MFLKERWRKVLVCKADTDAQATKFIYANLSPPLHSMPEGLYSKSHNLYTLSLPLKTFSRLLIALSQLKKAPPTNSARLLRSLNHSHGVYKHAHGLYKHFKDSFKSSWRFYEQC